MRSLQIRTDDKFACSSEVPEFVLLHASDVPSLRNQRREAFKNFATRHKLSGVFISGVQDTLETKEFVNDILETNTKTHILENAYSTFAEAQEACFRLNSFFGSIRPKVFSITEQQQKKDVKRGIAVATKHIGIQFAPKWMVYGGLPSVTEVPESSRAKKLIKFGILVASKPEKIHPAHKVFYERLSSTKHLRALAD